MDTFLDLHVPYSALLPVLEAMFWNNEAPFTGPNRVIIANEILYLSQRWYQDSVRSAGRGPFGAGTGVDPNDVAATLGTLMQNGIEEKRREACRSLGAQIERAIRGDR